jgi:hypothetical protein
MNNNKWEEKTARIVMVLVGLFCIFLSVYYSTQFYVSEFERPIYIAIIMSLVIGMFNAFSLVAASFLIRAKNYLLAIIFIPLMLFSVGFDIMTVVGAQSISYSQKKAEQEVVQQLEEAVSIEGQLLKDEIERYNEQLDTTKQMLASANSRLGPIRVRYDQASSEYEEVSSRVGTTDEEKEQIAVLLAAKSKAMKSAQFDKNEVEKEVVRLQNEIDSLSIKLNGASDNYKKYLSTQTRTANNKQTTEDNVQTFSQWLASVATFIPEEWLQFLLVLIPALFIDLISPIALNFGLTLVKSQTTIVGDNIKEDIVQIANIVENDNASPQIINQQSKDGVINDITRYHNKGLIIDKKDLEKNKFDSNSTINFRFGKTTQKVANTLSDFIDSCIGPTPGPFIKSVDEAARDLKISSSAKDVFIKHLSNLAIDNTPLIFKDEDGNCFSNFSSNQIKNYAMEIVA